jgi:hypothetical protein
MKALLDLPIISRVRRNHALEHATMHVLSERHPHLSLMGRSSLRGFYLYGPVEPEDVLNAAQEGLRRLRTGRREIAIHPNCGSNLAIAGVLAALGAFLAMEAWPSDEHDNRTEQILDHLSRLPLASMAAMAGIMLAKPLGPWFQSHVTTEAKVGNLHIVSITREKHSNLPVHFVHTEG